MKKITRSKVIIAMVAGGMLASSAHAGGPGIANDRFTNIGSIINTRHNLSQSSAPAIVASMDAYRNDYGEVCVYCHTPHGANNFIAAPLWNRTIKVTNYQTYDELGTTTLTQAVSSTPGAASLTCLSCHDGQTAVDSIINMPGSGMGLLTQQTGQSTAFLDSWVGKPGHVEATQHMGLNSTNGVLGNGTGSDTPYLCAPFTPGCTNLGGGIWVGIDPGKGCLVCHSDTGSGPGAGSYVNFNMFNLGTDLRNDHPIGVDFPATNGAGTDWNTPAGVQGSSNYFEVVANGRMDKDEIRTYNGKVE
ncbi:MAG: hypothetical protein ACOY9D_06285, partial [Pseudomonadota bacterium]